jgi:tetratricopeptide (TPR) repeat protein
MAFGAGTAEARNPHCSGGINYVVGGLRDKEKGNLEDYQREFQKAIQQLEQCSSEDPEDAEALGYLGWAYAEVDSCGPAGVAFQKAIDKLKAKNDGKKVEWATNNRDSYWANKFNDGIGKINAAQDTYKDLGKKPENEEEQKLQDEARKDYEAAIVSLTKASELRPNHPGTLRNLGSVYMFMGDAPKAMEIYQAGLAANPGDSLLTEALHFARSSAASQLVEQKKYDEAVAAYEDMLKSDPNNADLWSGLADARFQVAAKTEGDAKKPVFKQAGEAYAKAFSMKAENCDLAFNAALAFQNAGELSLSEPQWRNALKCKPGDPEAITSLASCLADEKKFNDAIAILLEGLAADPKNKVMHRQLGGVYTKAGFNSKANEELMVFLAMQNGQPAADAAAAAKGSAPAGAAGVKTLAANGSPEEVYTWEASGEKYDSWFYWTKKTAYHFKGGLLIATSDWSKGPGGTAKN